MRVRGLLLGRRANIVPDPRTDPFARQGERVNVS